MSRTHRIGAAAFRVAGWVLFFLTALGLAGRYVHPRHAWWVQVPATFLPVLALAGGAFAVVCVFQRRWVAAVLQATAPVIVASRYAMWGLLLPAKAMPSYTLTLITYNAAAIESSIEAVRDLTAMVEAERPDIICLQEFALHRSDTVVAEALRPTLDSLGYSAEAFFVDRWSVTDQAVITRLPSDPPVALRTRRSRHARPPSMGMRSELTWRGRRFALYNLHLQSYTTFVPWQTGNLWSLRSWLQLVDEVRTSFLVRAEEAETITRRIAREEVPVIVCGDLNSTPDHWVMAHLSERLPGRAVPSRRRATYPSDAPLVEIDYILASADWTIGERNTVAKLASDHRAVRATLTLHR